MLTSNRTLEPRHVASLPAASGGRTPRACKLQASRDHQRGLRSAGSSGSGAASSTWALKPAQLVPSDVTTLQDVVPTDAQLTVYTIRLTTSFARGAALSDPNSGVNVCLIGKDHRAALHRISPVNDALDSQAHNVEICQLVDADTTVGADCTNVLLADASSSGQQPRQPTKPAASGGAGPSARTPPQPSSAGRSGSSVGRAPPAPPPKLRFQEGSVDEVSILCPELGPLAAVLVGTEQGSWYLDELDVCSSRTRHIDRFVCRRMLGVKQGDGAAFLTPVPPGAVVYGEGESAVMLSKEQATALYSLNLAQYGDFKSRMLGLTALLVASGTSLAAVAGGPAAALPYMAGGATGLLYQWMLMAGVDHVVEQAATAPPPEPAPEPPPPMAPPSRPSGGASRGMMPMAPPPPPPPQVAAGGVVRTPGRPARAVYGHPPSDGSAMRRILGSPPLRLGLVCASAAVGLALVSQQEAAVDARAVSLALGGGGGAQPWQLAMGALGFFTYKMALVGASLGSSGTGGGTAGASKAVEASQRQQLEKFKRD